MLQRKRGSSTQSYFFSLLKYAAWKSAYFAFSPQFAHNFDIFAERVHTCTHSSSPLQHTQKAHKVAFLCHKLGRGGAAGFSAYRTVRHVGAPRVRHVGAPGSVSILGRWGWGWVRTVVGWLSWACPRVVLTPTVSTQRRGTKWQRAVIGWSVLGGTQEQGTDGQRYIHTVG